MPVSHQLQMAILASITSHNIYALSFDPVEVQSSTGNLLYAEMKFRNADRNAKIEASLAEADDLLDLGLQSQTPDHFNFFTRKSGDGTGVIVMTSTHPMIKSEQSILVKIMHGNAIHIQQIKTHFSGAHAAIESASSHEKILQPHIIGTEQEIALNLPRSALFKRHPASTFSMSTTTSNSSLSTAPSTAATVLLINSGAVPPLRSILNTATIATQDHLRTHAGAAQHLQNPMMTSARSAAPTSATLAQLIPIQVSLNMAPSPFLPTQSSQMQHSENQLAYRNKHTMQPHNTPSHLEKKSAKTSSFPARVHIVQAKESLWKIAVKVAAQSNHQPIPQRMQKIKADNPQAFIAADINRIRLGAALKLR